VLRPDPERSAGQSPGEGGEDAGARSSAGESGAEAGTETCTGTSDTWAAPALGDDDESRGVVDGPAPRAGDEPATIASGTGTSRWLCGLCTSACSDG
jgi:hypothetical protein